MRTAKLILEDGTEFCGWSFGYEAETQGEVVFNTAMTGYPESLTDPSYAGQILVSTFPLIGNYGVPDTGMGRDGLPLFMESDQIHVKALVVADYSEQYSHWNAKESLANWLKREKIPAITGIDTRRLTKMLREHGVMMGRIETHPQPLPARERSGYLLPQISEVAIRLFLIHLLPSLNREGSGVGPSLPWSATPLQPALPSTTATSLS